MDVFGEAKIYTSLNFSPMQFLGVIQMLRWRIYKYWIINNDCSVLSNTTLAFSASRGSRIKEVVFAQMCFC